MQYAMWDSVILAALDEDIGWGDITTECTVEPDAQSSAYLLAKEDLVVCGLDAVVRTFALLDERVKVILRCRDGDRLAKGDILADIDGPSRAILTGERTALNLLQRLSGIATRTRLAADMVKGTDAMVTDTRKTTPGLRVLEKYAVRTGGGRNHRMGLSDGALIKDNHIVAAGGIAEAVVRARNAIPHTLKIEVEASSLDEVAQAVEAGADIIMLDNMTTGLMCEAVELIAGRAKTEASGNMGDRDLLEVAQTGVDIISIGALTHTVRAADISLKFRK